MSKESLADKSSQIKAGFKTLSNQEAGESSALNKNTKSKSTDNYLTKISAKASNANRYSKRIDDISSNIGKKAAGISSNFSQMNLLNRKAGINGITLSDNEYVNNANQSVAIDMIKVNSQKLKAMIAKNQISGVRSKINYKKYLNAQKMIKKDINDMPNETKGQHVKALKIHNSLATSYANQLSSDLENANDNVSQASMAASRASINQESAATAFNNVSSLSNSFQQLIINQAESSAELINSVTDKTAKLYSEANNYNKQIAAASNSYSNNCNIAHHNQIIKTNLRLIKSSNTKLSAITSNTANYVNDLNSPSVYLLGQNYRNISSAANEVSEYRKQDDKIHSEITSAVQKANSIADTLFAQRVAINDGAHAYIPFKPVQKLNTKENTKTYIKYYNQGYREACHGFFEHLNKFINHQDVHNDNPNVAYRSGYKDAHYFIKGIDDSRKHTIKDSQLIDVTNYNYGYDKYHKILQMNNPLDINQSLSLNGSVLLIEGFLMGYNN